MVATDVIALSPRRRALLELYVRGNQPTRQGGAAAHAGPAPADDRPHVTRVAPCSHAQRRLWFLSQLQDQEDPYILHSLQELDWQVSPPLLEQALTVLVDRHEILRTTFGVHEDGQPHQYVADTGQIELQVHDLRDQAESERRSEAARRAAAVVSRRMDLERGPLLRAALYRLDEQLWVFLLAAHHIVFDGPSFPLLFAELRDVYATLATGHPPLLTAGHPQYADLVARREAALTPERVDKELEFWTTELAGLPMLDLPLDRPRTPTPSFGGSLHTFSVPPDLAAGLRQLGATHNATVFMVLLSGLAATLCRSCGQGDFAVGLPVAGRDRAEMTDAIGFFVDTVVVRCRLDDDPTVADLVGRIREAVSRSLAHRLLPFDVLVEHLRPERETGVNPLFQVGFQLADQGGVADGTLDLPRTGAMFDLGLAVWPDGAGLVCRLEYTTDLFDHGTAESLGAAYLATLESMLDPARRVGELTVWRADRPGDQAILVGETDPQVRPSFPHALADIVRRHPDAVAVEGDDDRLTYAQLDARVGRLAAALVRRGVGPGCYVALSLPRSVELVCLQLAAWGAGAAFVPMDPRWPQERRDQVLESLGEPLLVTPDTVAELISEAADIADAAAVLPGIHDVAYAIFTSGSTGTPKGVVLEHGGLANVTTAQASVFGLQPGRRVAQLATPTFDASVFELVLALGVGATLVVAPPETLAGDELAQFLTARSVDTIVVPPSLLATVRPLDAPGVRLVCVAGESCRTDLADEWEPGREFWNLYGPTETTIWATYGQGRAGARVPIGRPVANTVTRVVDAHGRTVAVGVAGELLVGGAGVARGYLGDPALTTTRFGAWDAASPLRFYRTGDLVRQRRDGNLVFLGRVDRQVKVRGFRIEPEEVESVLRRHPRVTDAVVEARAPGGGTQVLTAYVQCPHAERAVDGPVAGPDGLPDADEIRQLVADTLPHYMVPSHVVVLPRFPRSPSGKVDRAALPDPVGEQDDRYVAPATATERTVAELMARAARIPRIGARDDFFAVGGHSLAAAEVVSRVRGLLAVNLSIRDVFAHRTVTELAGRIDVLAATTTADDEPDVPLVRLPRGTRPATVPPPRRSDLSPAAGATPAVSR